MRAVEALPITWPPRAEAFSKPNDQNPMEKDTETNADTHSSTDKFISQKKINEINTPCEDMYSAARTVSRFKLSAVSSLTSLNTCTHHKFPKKFHSHLSHA